MKAWRRSTGGSEDPQCVGWGRCFGGDAGKRSCVKWADVTDVEVGHRFLVQEGLLFSCGDHSHSRHVQGWAPNPQSCGGSKAPR